MKRIILLILIITSNVIFSQSLTCARKFGMTYTPEINECNYQGNSELIKKYANCACELKKKAEKAREVQKIAREKQSKEDEKFKILSKEYESYYFKGSDIYGFLKRGTDIENFESKRNEALAYYNKAKASINKYPNSYAKRKQTDLNYINQNIEKLKSLKPKVTVSLSQNNSSYSYSQTSNSNNNNIPITIEQKKLKLKHLENNGQGNYNEASILRREIYNQETSRNEKSTFKNKIEQEAQIKEISTNYSNKIDEVTQGNDFMAASLKGGMAVYQATELNRLDGDLITGATSSIISGLSALGDKRRARQAQLLANAQAVKMQLEKEEALKVQLRKLRTNYINTFSEKGYPTNQVNINIGEVYFFAVYANNEELRSLGKEIQATNIFKLVRYKDGSWPFENITKKTLEKYSIKKMFLTGYYQSYNEALSAYSSLDKAIVNTKAKLNQTIDVSMDFDNSASSNINNNSTNKNVNFWGEEVKTKKEIKNKAKDDFWNN